MSALTASMGVEIAVVFVKQTHSRNGISRRAGLRRNPLSVLPAPRAQTAPKSSRLSLLQRAVYGDFTRSNSPVVVLLLVVLQLAGPDSDCTKGRRPNLDEGGRLATPKMNGFGVQGLSHDSKKTAMAFRQSRRRPSPLTRSCNRGVGGGSV